MKKILPIIVLVLVVSAPFAQAQFTVENIYDAPYVTNGIEYVDGYIYYNHIGSQTITKMDPADGSTVSSFGSPVPSAHDLAWDGQYFWSDDMFIDNLIYQFDMNGTVISTIPEPSVGSMGLAYDGTYLWSTTPTIFGGHGDGKIRKLDPGDGTILATIDAPVTTVMGLTWYDSYLWTLSAEETSPGSGEYESTIWQINPDGTVENSYIAPFDPSIARPEDLVWDDSGNLWVAVDTWNGSYGNDTSIYQLSFSVIPEPVSSTLFIIGGAALGFRRFRKKFQ